MMKEFSIKQDDALMPSHGKLTTSNNPKKRPLTTPQQTTPKFPQKSTLEELNHKNIPQSVLLENINRASLEGLTKNQVVFLIKEDVYFTKKEDLLNWGKIKYFLNLGATIDQIKILVKSDLKIQDFKNIKTINDIDFDAIEFMVNFKNLP